MSVKPRCRGSQAEPAKPTFPDDLAIGWLECTFSRRCAKIPNKQWNTLKKAAETYPQWVAAINGQMGEAVDGGFRLDNPSLQVFEKKPKPEAAATRSESEPAAPAAPAPVPSPLMGRPRLSLKGRSGA
jgi:hypothetical protein